MRQALTIGSGLTSSEAAVLENQLSLTFCEAGDPDSVFVDVCVVVIAVPTVGAPTPGHR